MSFKDSTDNSYELLELDLGQLFQVMWRQKWLLVGLILFSIITFLSYSLFCAPPRYETQVMMQSGDSLTVRTIVTSPSFTDKLLDSVSGYPERDAKSAVDNLSFSISANRMELKTYSHEPSLSYEVIVNATSLLLEEYEEKTAETRQFYLEHLSDIHKLQAISNQIVLHSYDQIETILAQESISSDEAYLLINIYEGLQSIVRDRLYLLLKEIETALAVERLSITILHEPQMPLQPGSHNYSRIIGSAIIVSLLAWLFIVGILICVIKRKSPEA